MAGKRLAKFNAGDKLRVVLIKPSKYAHNGFVERFWRGFMPNSTLTYMYALTRDYIRRSQANFEVFAYDEYVQNNLDYLELVRRRNGPTLVALVGVQSHQFHRALDLAALALRHGAQAIIGGPHTLTCDTSLLHNRGISFALAEGELIWERILQDASRGRLEPVYGRDRRWQPELDSPVIRPPSKEDLKRFVVPMLGLYPSRGCPFRCNFCSVIKIAGRRIRSQAVEVTLESLRRAKAAGVQWIMFTSDNFNKIPEVRQILQAMIEEKLQLPFFIQCDTQIGDRDADLIPLLSEAGCFQMFVGVESFSRRALREARKYQNHPDRYADIVKKCREHRIGTHFSNIIGFPGETPEEIRTHLDTLRKMRPSQASFYILTPIPGTEQYDDFRARNLIFEPNLDRFDGTCPTWRHDVLGPGQLRKLLFRCYRRFYELRRSWDRNRQRSSYFDKSYLASALFTKLNAFKKTHPMSGGVWRIKLDHVEQYLGLRKSAFGFKLMPLPDSLSLSPSDEQLNRLVKLSP